MFKPKDEYIVRPDIIPIKKFHDNKDRYTIRPPYQRKSVWSQSKKQALLDSLFRRYYIPKIVIREVKINEENYKMEVVDGQQRILTVQEFFADEIKLPVSLTDFSQSYEVTGKKYSELPDEMKHYLNDLSYDVDVIKGIDDPRNRKHQTIAMEIFRRLQEGEPLNFMEKIHAKLASVARNFITLHADEISFDLDNYEPLNSNQSRHKFFTLLKMSNKRMKHLELMARFLLIEMAGGAVDIGQEEVEQMITNHEKGDGIGKTEFTGPSDKKVAAEVIKTLNLFYDIFKNDITIDGDSGVKELSTEYFILSMYVLLKHLRGNYVIDDGIKIKFKEFLSSFFQRWKADDESDREISIFRDKRQQDGASIEARDRIVRQIFFEFYPGAKRKDTRRAFNEAQRIKIYREQNGVCQMCVKEGVSEENAKVPWKQYEADHILAHSLGGATDPWNGQVLCERHNQIKSNQ